MESNAQSPVPAPAAAPVMDVRPPEAAPVQPAPAPDAAAVNPVPSKAVKQPKPPKQHNPNLDLAIAATVIIVLGVAALFVYAYLQTQK